MQVIPVLDLKANTVVRGVAGQREQYRPLESRLVASAEPLAVLSAFAALGAPACYVADLDAITGAGSHLALCPRLAAAGLPLWIDAGVTTVAAARALLDAGATRPIVALETLPSLARAAELAAWAADSAGAPPLFSLDLRAGRLVTRIPELAGLTPAAALERLYALGWRHFILLDVARVGVGAGPPLELVRAARSAFPAIEIVSGGGVRDRDDLEALAAAGCDAVLVASALHSGALGPDIFTRR